MRHHRYSSQRFVTASSRRARAQNARRLLEQMNLEMSAGHLDREQVSIAWKTERVAGQAFSPAPRAQLRRAKTQVGGQQMRVPRGAVAGRA